MLYILQILYNKKFYYKQNILIIDITFFLKINRYYIFTK